jgi:Uncharacterized conserved small protein
MNKFKVSYDKETDILYFYTKGDHEGLLELSPEISVEYNKAREIVGIEILDASKFLKDVITPLQQTLQKKVRA